ncbi:hypothetical protein [Methyloprofundus sp.]|uniref:hypothetical protein n=1 Tax=Methyloprofundus sp. TaxID=2020875 RepID=UPI003D1355F3
MNDLKERNEQCPYCGKSIDILIHAYPVSTGYMDLASFGCACPLSYKPSKSVHPSGRLSPADC